MVKATQRDFESAAARAVLGGVRLFFLCGPDEAGIAAGGAQLISLLDEPGERVDLAGGDLKADPVRLDDEARSTSLFGDTRHLVVRAAGDDVEKAVELVIAGDVAPCPVIILAAGATEKSRTAKLLVNRPDALVAVFWPPDLGDAAAIVRRIADRAGVRLDQALSQRIARATGLDSRLAAAEIEKLALYLDAAPEHPRTADGAALDAIGAHTEDDGLAAIVAVVLAGESRRVAAELNRIVELGLNPVSVLLAFERRVAQLTQLAGRMRGRGDAAGVVEREGLALRVFHKDKREVIGQLSFWHGKRLQKLTNRLTELHRALLTNSQDAELLLLHGLGEIARFVAGQRLRNSA